MNNGWEDDLSDASEPEVDEDKIENNQTDAMLEGEKEISLEEYVQNMLNVQPARQDASGDVEDEDLFNEAAAEENKRLSKKFTNVLSSANKMTRSIVSTAATKTYSVTKTIVDV